MKNTLILIALAGLSPAAMAQIVPFAANRSVTAEAADGGAANTFNSTSLADFDHSVTKTYFGGLTTAHAISTTTSSRLTNDVFVNCNAQNHDTSATARALYAMTFSAAAPIDASILVTGSAGPGGEGGQNFTIWNHDNNQIMAQGSGQQSVSLPAGNYRVVHNVFTSWLPYNAEMTIDFRPANDRCDRAMQIGNGTVNGTTLGATPDGIATCGSSGNSPSVWFRYVSAGNGALRVHTCGSDFDTVLSAYNPGSCPLDQADQIDCNDDAFSGILTPCVGTHQSGIVLGVTTGQVVYFRVSGYNTAAGRYTLNVGPLNDFPAGAIELESGVEASFDNRLATTDGPIVPDCSNNGVDNQVNGDLWYRYTPETAGRINVSTCGSGFDTKLAVYTGNPNQPGQPMTYVACNDDACGVASRLENLAVTPGTTYYIRVGGYRTYRGDGIVRLDFSDAPACPADFNRDGFLDFFDYDDYVACFEGVCPPGRTADFNDDGFADFFDYDDFVSAFETGC